MDCQSSRYFTLLSFLIEMAFLLIIRKDLLNTPTSLLEDSINYMSISMCGLIVVILYYIPFSILCSLGDAKWPIIFLAVCSILNIAFDLIFVLVFHTGVGGTAIASLLAQGIAGILCFIYAVKKYSYSKMALKQSKFGGQQHWHGSAQCCLLLGILWVVNGKTEVLLSEKIYLI